jgi:peptide/nickel transport system permease protein
LSTEPLADSSMVAGGVAVAHPATSPVVRRSRLRHLHRVPPAVWVCATVLVAMILAAAFAPILSPHDPTEQSLLARLQGPAWAEGGDASYPLGTDHLGRDLLSRLLYGARISLAIGFFAVLIGATLGSIAGMVAGYFGGWLDECIMTLADIQLAFPFILLAIAIIAVLGVSHDALPLNLVIVVGISGWMTYARVCRSVVLSLKEREFVQAVQALGGSNRRILFLHLLPNIMSPIVVLTTLDLARLIILESTLSFLSLGVQPPNPSWGTILLEGRQYLDTAWWISTFAGLAIMLTTVAISRGGDWIRDVLDPTLRSA